MRFVVAVVVGAVLCGVGHPASAAEARRERSERCLEICNFTFEQCQKETSPKANGQCNIDVVRCKNACPFVTVEEPAVPTVASHGRCIEDCRTTYKKCTQKSENKTSGKCAADDVRCEQGCKKPPEEVVPAAAGGAPGAPGAAGAAAAAPAKKPKRGPRVEGAAAPAPLAPPPVVPPREHPAPSAEPARPVQPAEAPAAAPARSEAVAPAAAPPAAPTAAAHPEPEKRGFFATLGCFFVACDVPGSTPCVQQCNTAYDECRVRESKRGGECNTRLMNCRKFCSEQAPAK